MAQQQATADGIRQKVRELVAEVTERSPEEILDTARLVEDLGIDSLMRVEILVTVDKKYRIQIPEEEFATIRTVKDAVEVVQQCLATTAGKTA